MRIQTILRGIIFIIAVFTAGTTAYASFHIMQIEQVIGGVNGDTSAQAIQLRMRAAGQNFVSQARLVVRDAAGLNPILVKDLTTDVANGAAGDRVLIVSSTFTNLTTPATLPDFVMTQTIPASYLAAGRLTYEDDFGMILWSVSWGGTNYTGPETGSLVNDADGNFGPPFSGPLPSTNTSALQFTGAIAAPSVNNAADYALTSGPAIFVNNARDLFSLGGFEPHISALGREGNDIRITWTTLPGKTNALQRTLGTTNSNYFTNFADVFLITNSLGSTTNFLDVGAGTNSSGYYRVRFVP
jgi:hypothetical protein